MKNLVDLEKFINSELTSKINNSFIKHDSVYVTIDHDKLIDVISFLKANDFMSVLDLLICSSPLLMDALVCVLRRFVAKENVFSPHTLHLYQRLYKAGWSHWRVSTQYIVATVLLIFSCLSNNLALKITCICLVYLYAFYLDQKCAKSFLVSISKSSKN